MSEYTSCKSVKSYSRNLLISACYNLFRAGSQALSEKVLTLCSIKTYTAACQGLSARTITHFTKSVKPIIVHNIALLRAGKAELIRLF